MRGRKLYFITGWHSLLQRASGNSEDLEDPLDLSVGAVVSTVEAQKKLVTEDGRKQLRTVVVESAMPRAFVNVEQRFEPFVEGLDRGRSASRQSSSDGSLEELASLVAVFASVTTLATFRVGRARMGMFAVSLNLRTQEMTSGASFLVIPFEGFGKPFLQLELPDTL